jgi:hypothetical protein
MPYKKLKKTSPDIYNLFVGQYQSIFINQMMIIIYTLVRRTF